MKSIQITPNISLQEFLEGKNLPKEAIKMNYEDFDESKLPVIVAHLSTIQFIRNEAKKEFGDRFRGVLILAGLRVKRWELERNRSGESRHTKYDGSDIIPICNDEDYLEIFNWIFNRFKDTWAGGWAKKEPVVNGDKVERTGFIHVDNRGNQARWTY